MRVFVFILALIYAPMAMAQTKDLQIEMAADRVDISTGFNGTRVVLFGTMKGTGDLVMTLKGPEKKVIVRRKDRVLGTWLNRMNVEFRRVPSYYDYAATLDDAALSAYPDVLKEGEVGVDHLGLYPENADGEVADIFRDSLIRGMQQNGLYPIKASGLSFISPGFFKASFELPPGVPTGIYTVEGLLIRDGKIAAKELKTLQVGQVGFNARVYSFADEHSFFYGVFAVLMALVSGWSAFTFLRRD